MVRTWAPPHAMIPMSFRPLAFAIGFIVADASSAAAPAALLLLTGDQHSAYERTAQLVAQVDRLRSENPGLPMAMLIDGDTFEYGNIVARRSGGAVDFAMLAALAGRLPTILNLGNHEAEFFPMDDTVARLAATGVTVIGNIRNHATGQPFAPSFTRLRLGDHKAVVVGFTTDHLATYPAAVRPTLDLANPVAWAKEYLPPLLGSAPLRIVLSHSGVQADRAILPYVPDGTLFAGAHDHLCFVHHQGRTAYVHSGSWNDHLTLAWLSFEDDRPVWTLEQRPLSSDGPADPALAALILETRAAHLAPADTRVIGRTTRAYAPAEAARFVAESVRAATGADVAVIANTTFGAGLPAGPVTQTDFDACVRFENDLMIGEVDGIRLRAILAGANQGPDTPFELRRGEFLVAAVTPGDIDPARRYRIATSDWISKNAKRYLGDESISFTPVPGLRFKATTAAALQPTP